MRPCSRVGGPREASRSTVHAFTTLGAEVTLVAPPTLLPFDNEGWPAAMTSEFDDVLTELDAVYLLRVQTERGGASVFPSLGEYRTRFGLTADRFRRLKPDTVVLHPGPMIRGGGDARARRNRRAGARPGSQRGCGPNVRSLPPARR